jgi:hypothetical protein
MTPFSVMPSSVLQKFMNMDEEMRLEVAGKMRKQQTENIMLLVAEINAENESMHEESKTSRYYGNND